MKITLMQGDITTLSVDAIVNAADSELLGGGGVDGAIHDAAGPELLKACKHIRKTQYPNGLPTGEAVIIPGFQLPARFVIATVGPIYEQDDFGLLKNCYTNSLKLADKFHLKRIAFPSISTGAYGVPIEKAIPLVKEAVQSYTPTSVQEVIFVLHSDKDFSMYMRAFGNDKTLH